MHGSGRRTSTRRAAARAALGVVTLLLVGALGTPAALATEAPDDPSTTTTTTTAPEPEPSSTTTTTTRPAAGDERPAPVTPPTTAPQEESAGPPRLRSVPGVRLPSDSETAALLELSLLREHATALDARAAELDAKLAADAVELEAVRAERATLDSRRIERAVAMYRGQPPGWRLGGLILDELDRERALALIDRANDAGRKAMRTLRARVKKLEEAIAANTSERSSVARRRSDAQSRIDVLMLKLAAQTTVGLVSAPGVPSPGPAPVARSAALALQALDVAMLSGQPLDANPGWVAARTAFFETIAGPDWGNVEPTPAAPSAGSAAFKLTVGGLDASWRATPPVVLRAVLLAVSQTGKPYVYATAGPETYDCSGLTKRAYAEIGIGLPHFSGSQLRLGLPISADMLRPGDLLAYGPDGAEHVTMYVGGGLVVEARGRAYGVVVNKARTAATDDFAGASRFVP